MHLHKGLTVLLSMNTLSVPTVCQQKEMGNLHRHRKAEFRACLKVQCTGSIRYLWGPRGHGREGLVAAERLELE